MENEVLEAAPDALDQILGIEDADKRGRAVLEHCLGLGGGVQGGADGLDISPNGKLRQREIDAIKANRGSIMKALPGGLILSGSKDPVRGPVPPDDARAAPPFAVPEPASSQQARFFAGATQQDAIDWLSVPGLAAAMCYWGARRDSARAELLRELADELDKPARGAGLGQMGDLAWLRKTDGTLLIVRRAE